MQAKEQSMVQFLRIRCFTNLIAPAVIALNKVPAPQEDSIMVLRGRRHWLRRAIDAEAQALAGDQGMIIGSPFNRRTALFVAVRAGAAGAFERLPIAGRPSEDPSSADETEAAQAWDESNRVNNLSFK